MSNPHCISSYYLPSCRFEIFTIFFVPIFLLLAILSHDFMYRVGKIKTNKEKKNPTKSNLIKVLDSTTFSFIYMNR